MIFERVIEQILQKFLLKSCLMDLDDVIIFGKSFEKMTENFKKSFMRKINLKINPKTLYFLLVEK